MSIANRQKHNKIKEKRPFMPFNLTKISIELVAGIAASSYLLR